MAHNTTRSELESLLAEGVESALERERTAFDLQAGPFNEALVIFGAGNLGQLAAAGLRKVGIEPLAFVDNNPSKWNTTVNGIAVLNPETAALRFGKTAAFVVTIWGPSNSGRMRDRVQQLKSLGCERVIPFGPLFWKYPREMLPYYSADLPHKVQKARQAILEAHDLWSDHASRTAFANQIRWRSLFDFDAVTDSVSHRPYFPPDLCAVSTDDVFVDCGSYDGDTIDVFLEQCQSRFSKIIAFEPDPVNFQRLEKKARGLFSKAGERLVTLQAATGARSELLPMGADGSVASHILEAPSPNSILVRSVALDEVVYADSPTYVKMDVEGFELETIRGAENIIRDHAPIMAICSYHVQDHVWEIPRLISSFNEHYSFFLRAHEAEIWDLVCYAIPHNRLLSTAA